MADYQGMTADEKLTVLLIKMETVEDNLPKCPAKLCQNHDRRITRLETIVTCSAFSITVIVAILLKVI